MQSPPAIRPFADSPFRLRVLALAARLADFPLTTVVAPAGSGKTTLLGSWREQLPQGIRSVWLDMRMVHADAATWVGDLLDAIRPALPAGRRFGAETSRILLNLAGGDEDWRPLHRAFLRDWLVVEGETVVFLDSFHAVPAGSSTEQLVSELLRGLPTNLHLVVATRGTLPAAALRLAAGGLVQELEVDDLNLRFEEAAELLRMRGIEPDEGLVTSLLARTEGWVTGLLLAARALARIPPAERQAYAERIGREPDLFAYVAAEVLAGESEAQIRLLECAAVLGRSEPEALCELFGDDCARELVERALDQGLLLSDGREVWPHQLWQELLRRRLRERLDDDAWRALHGRAARLLADGGKVEDALEAYRESEDWAAIAYLLHHVGHEWLDRGRYRGIRRWLDALPVEVRESEPILLEMAGMLLMQVDPGESSRLLERGARAFAERGDREGEVSVLGALAYHQLSRMRMREAQGTLRRMITLREVVTQPRARAAAYVGIAGFSQLRRRFKRSRAFSERAARMPLDPILEWFNVANLALIHTLSGDLERARRLLDEALERPTMIRRAFAYYTLLCERAMVLIRLGDLSAARRDLEIARKGFEEFELVRFQLLVEILEADLLGHGEDREACERAFDAAVRHCRKSDAVAAEAFARGQMALRWLRWDEPERAHAEAERATELYEKGISEGAILFPWWYLFSLWVLARTGDAAAALQRARAHGKLFAQPDLPMVHVAMLLAWAGLGRQAGEKEDAERHALEAWRFAEREGAPLDPSVAPLVLPFAASVALRRNVAADRAFETLRRLRPDAVPQVLSELLRDRSAEVRRRAIARIAEFGGRELYPALERAARDRNSQVRAAAERLLPQLDLRPDYELRLETLGRFRALRGDVPIADGEWRGSVSKRLLQRLLAAEGRPLSREVLQADLWPDADESSGGNNLRVALSRLSDALDPDRIAGSPAWFLTSGPAGLALDLDRIGAWDVASFRSDLREAEAFRAQGRMEDALDGYARALDRYAGPFLPEAAYEEWVMPLRRRLEEEFRGVGERYGALLLDGGRHDEAVHLADRLLDQDPADEQAWALRMRAQLARGDRTAAFRSYQQACEALRVALELEPGEELRDLVARARAGGPR